MLRKSLKIILTNMSLVAIMVAQADVISITNPATGETIDTSVVTVSFTIAAYYTVGDSGCADCDGFIRAFLNNSHVASLFSSADFEISNINDGRNLLRLEAIHPNGTSFDPAIEDTVSFSVIGNPLPVTNLTATALDEEVALSWTSPNTPSYVFFEDFTNGIPITWTVVDGGTSNDTWTSPVINHVWTAFGDDLYVICDSDAADPNAVLDEELITPSLNFSNQSTPYLQFESYYDDITPGNEYAEVDVTVDGGSSWTNVLHWDDDQGSSSQPVTAGVDLSTVAGGESDVKIRFRYTDGGEWAWYWALDNVRILDSNPGTSRWNDGDLTHYNIYLDGILLEDSVETTMYLVTGLTNSTTYSFGVSAAYYPGYESDTSNVSAMPTWLYGDITGTITDPNGNTLDSAIVFTGSVIDTTGSDGTYLLSNLDPGVHTIQVTRDVFDRSEEQVTVIAQEAVVVQNFVLTPALAQPGGLETSAGDTTVHLIWRKPGTILAGDLTGVWNLFFDWGCYGYFGNVEVEFTEDGGIYIYGDLIGQWVGENGVVDLGEAGSCPAVSFEFNAYFSSNYYNTIYYMNVDGDEFSGVIDGGYGDHDGDNYGQRLNGRQAGIAVGNQDDVESIFANGDYKKIVNTKFSEDVMLKKMVDRQIHSFKAINRIKDVNYFSQLRRAREDSLLGYHVYQILNEGDSLVYTTSGSDDTTATITVSANYIEYCYNVRARWNTDDYGILESKPSNDACAVPYKSGDIDFTNVVDLSDLLAVVDFALGVDLPTEAQFRNADMNNDMEINIADIVMIVDVIVGGGQNARTLAANDTEVFADLLQNGNELLINVDYDGYTRGVQFTLRADQTINMGTPILSVNDEGVMVVFNKSEDGNIFVVVFNSMGGTVDRSNNSLVRLPFTFTGKREDKAVVELTEVKAAGMAGESLPVTIREKRIDISVVPNVFALHQNYPNPFNPVTEIQFDVPEETQITLTVYNIMGQEVTTLTNGKLKAGFHSIRWDGTNGTGELVGTGLYFYRLSSPSFISTKKMILVK